jgi:hypothetical protein
MRGGLSTDGAFERWYCGILAALIWAITSIVLVFALK